MKLRFLIIVLFSVFYTNAQSLSLDSTFGNSGKLVLPIISQNQIPVKVFYENNKYIFIYSSNGLCSVNYNGTLNNSFGTNGSFILNNDNNSDTYYVKGAKLLNGYIYIFGQKSTTSNSNKDGFIAKISLSGSYDLSFGTNGKAIFNLGENDEIINDITLNSSNQIYAIGTRNSRIFLLKTNSNGIIDTTFDSIGYKSYILNEFENSNGINLYFQTNEILLVGCSNFPSNIAGSPKYLILLKVDENGIQLSNFGVNGLKQVLFSNSDSCYYTINRSYLKDNNELYFQCLMSCSFNGQFMDLYKYNFAQNSITTLTSLPYNYPSFEIDLSSKIIVSGTPRCDFSPCAREYGIYKKNSDGTPDLSFNTSGSYFYRFGPVSDDLSSVFYKHDDGKILLAGYTFNSSNGNGLGMIRLMDSGLNLEEKDINQQFTLFPNPTDNKFFIVNKSDKEIENIEVIDINGRKVEFINNDNRTINIENLQKGIYFVKISSDNKSFVYKLIKE